MSGEVRVGDKIPGFEVEPSEVQLFLFSAVTWNPHRIHFDEPYATDTEGHRGVIVQGPLLGSWMLRLAEEWSREWGTVTTFEYRNIHTATVDERLTVLGEVTSAGDEITLATRIVAHDGAVISAGTGTVRRN